MKCVSLLWGLRSDIPLCCVMLFKNGTTLLVLLWVKTAALPNPRGCHSHHHQSCPTACFYKESFIGAQPCPCISVLSMAAFPLHKNEWCPVFYQTTLAVTAKLSSCDRGQMAQQAKLFIIWAENVCPSLVCVNGSLWNYAVPRLCSCMWRYYSQPVASWQLYFLPTSDSSIAFQCLLLFRALNQGCVNRESWAFPRRSFPANLSQNCPLSLLLAAPITTATLPKPQAP